MVGIRSSSGRRSAGGELKAARGKRKLSLDEAAAALRIPPKHLAALEEEDFTVFSAHVYAKGAYIKYAQFLGVDTDTSYRAFLRTLSGAQERVPLRVPLPRTWLQRVLTPYGVIAAGVALAVLAVAGYIGNQVHSYVRLPQLALHEPSEPIVRASQVVVRGEAEAEARVTVNGEAVLLDDNNEFESILPLRGGINVIQVEATGASGRTSVVRQDVLVPRR